MINEVYRLIAPMQLRTDFVAEEVDENEILVRPTYLCICAADQRYYTGSRGKEILSQKLPMALIHEAVGQVVYDPSGEYAVGQSVVLIPNTPVEKDEIVKENYLRSSKYRSSSMDGFMQNMVVMRKDRIIPFSTNVPERTAVLLEMMSVVMNALENFKKMAHSRRDVIGVWGNGNVGFISSLLLKHFYPESKIVVLGVDSGKMRFFPFADETYLINDLPEGFYIDHAFECVGGGASGDAINQIIDYIKPQGTISLMGVSEQNVAINTRMVLEKGLTLLGNSRSGYDDFKNSVDILETSERIRDYMDTIISEEIEVFSMSDMARAFEHDQLNDFKTVMKWCV